MVDQSLVDKIISDLLTAESVMDFDNVIKVLVFDHGIRIIRRMVEDKEKLGNIGEILEYYDM